MNTFAVSDVATISKAIYADLAKDLPDEIRIRLKSQRVAQRHSNETRMFMFHFYDTHQPQILDFHHFGYALVYDPILRWHPKPCIARFYANRHRIYDKKDIVIPALWEAMLEAEKVLYNFQPHENTQMIALMRMFDVSSLDDFKNQAYQAFLELIPYWHSKYAAVIDNYGVNLTKMQIKEVIANRAKFQPTGSRSAVARTEYSRHIPQRLREQVFARDGYKCLKCGTSLNLHVDHIKPVANGGLTVFNNLQTLCATDNYLKSNRDNIDYRK